MNARIATLLPLLALSSTAAAADWELFTTDAAGIGSRGNMFALTASNDVSIDGVEIYMDYGSTTTGCEWEVYTSTSDYTTVYNDSTAWTLLDSGTFTPTVSSDELVELWFATPHEIANGDTVSFYVTLTDTYSCSLNYTNGTTQGTVYAADANLSIDEGYGASYSFPSSPYSPRIFNGSIFYSTCEDGYLDEDGDGFGDATTYDCHLEGEVVADDTDCDDADATINPDATELWYDGVDQDCDEASDYDADIDGFDSDLHSGTDCDDADATVNTDATEVWYDGVDQDCDAANDYDADADGFDSDLHAGDDCDDADGTINPDATEVWYDGVDQDCDRANDYDADADGSDSIEHGGDDCDDAEATVNPEATEVWYDGVDGDCDGANDNDADADGHDADAAGGEDCDDADATVNTDATEVWYDGVDQDCDGGSDDDADGDGHDADSAGGTDCDDADAGINPDAEDVVGDGIDQDCDGADATDEAEEDEDDDKGSSCASVGAQTPIMVGAGLALLGLMRRRED